MKMFHNWYRIVLNVIGFRHDTCKWLTYQGGVSTLQLHHNERYDVLNHRCIDCLLNHLFRHRSKETSKLRVTCHCKGNSTVTEKMKSTVCTETSESLIAFQYFNTRNIISSIEHVKILIKVIMNSSQPRQLSVSLWHTFDAWYVKGWSGYVEVYVRWT